MAKTRQDKTRQDKRGSLMTDGRTNGSLDRAMNDIFAGNGLLFLGAGASTIATNSAGLPLPTGGQLADSLADECGVGKNYGLNEIASHFLKTKSETALVGCLKRLLTTRNAPRELLPLLDQPWIRVWTTNYDNVCKIAHEALGKSVTQLTTGNDIANARARKPTILHINGLLERIGPTIPEDFVLTSRDYATTVFAESPWSDVFKDDIRRAKAIIFVGYSLADIDVARFIAAPHVSRKKIHFIDSELMDDVLKARLEDFGEVHPIGISNFSDDLVSKKAVWQEPDTIEYYEGFEKIEVPKTASAASDNDFFNLMIFGDMDFTHVAHQFENAEDPAYILRRDFEDDCAVDLQNGTTDVVLVGSFGCGKSIAANSIALRVATSGHDVFRLNRKTDRTEEDLIKLCRREDPFTLFVDGTRRNGELLSIFVRNAAPECTLLLTERSELFEFASGELDDRLAGRKMRFEDLDRLTDSEVDRLIALITIRGAWNQNRTGATESQQKTYIVNKCQRQMNSVLIDIIRAKTVLDRLASIVDGFCENEGGKRALVAICLLQCIEETPYIETLEDLLDFTADQFKKLTRNDHAKLILTPESNAARFRSPIVASNILSAFEHASEITQIIEEIVINAKQLGRTNRGMGFIGNSLIQYRVLERMLPGHGRRIALQNLYENVKPYFRNGRDPVFWLQYGISRISLNDIKTARQWFENGYRFGKQHPGFATSSIKRDLDNHYARLLFHEAMDEPDEDKAFSLVREGLETVKKQIWNRNRHYPYRVAGEVEFAAKRHAHAWSPDKIEYIEKAIDDVIDSVANLDRGLSRHRHVVGGIKRLKDVRQFLESEDPS